jgi:hypothetical protein
MPDRYFSCRKADALSVVRAADCPTVSAAKGTLRKPILSYAVSHSVASTAVQVLLVSTECCVPSCRSLPQGYLQLRANVMEYAIVRSRYLAVVVEAPKVLSSTSKHVLITFKFVAIVARVFAHSRRPPRYTNKFVSPCPYRLVPARNMQPDLQPQWPDSESLGNAFPRHQRPSYASASDQPSPPAKPSLLQA